MDTPESQTQDTDSCNLCLPSNPASENISFLAKHALKAFPECMTLNPLLVEKKKLQLTNIRATGALIRIWHHVPL